MYGRKQNNGKMPVVSWKENWEEHSVTWETKNPNTLSRKPKKNKKKLGNQKIIKNQSFWPESKDSIWKDGFLDSWIFGSIWSRISASKNDKKSKMISKQLWLQGTDIMHFIRVFDVFFIIWYCIYCICTYILACPPQALQNVGPGGACDNIYSIYI